MRDLVAAVSSGWLVTVGDNGFPAASLLPIIWTGDTVIAHLARANPQWRGISDGTGEPTPALVICGGPEAYISPSWYAAKAEHGRVVPTWNYSAVHLSGTARVHQDPDWVRAAVTELTERHEAGRRPGWQVGDAPESFLAGQLRGIVGIEIAVLEVEGKAKLSQNRSEADQLGVISGLRSEPGAGPTAVAAAMTAAMTEHRRGVDPPRPSTGA